MNAASVSLPGLTDMPAPLYYKVKADLLRRIHEGEFRIGSRLPTEQALCSQYGVGRNTARTAMELLESDGLVERFQGRGTFLSKRPQAREEPPHLRRTVSLRVRVNRHLAHLWSGPEFRAAFAKTFPSVRLEPIESDFSTSEELLEGYVGSDLYFPPAFMIRPLERTFMLGDWERLFPPQEWAAMQADLHPEVGRAFGKYSMTKLIPWTFSPLVMAYNRRLFSQAGLAEPSFRWTEAEFLQACQELRTRLRRQAPAPFVCELSSLKRWPFAIYREGGRIWDEEGLNCQLDQPAVLAGARFLKKLAGHGLMKSILSARTVLDCSLFARDRAALQLASLATVKVLEKSGHGDWGLVAVPEGRRRATVMTETALAYSPHTREPGLVADFVRFLRGQDQVWDQFSNWFVPVAFKSALKHIRSRLSRGRLRYLDAILDVTADMEELEYPASHEASLRLDELINHVWFDLQHAPARCREVAAEINSLRELNRLRG